MSKRLLKIAWMVVAIVLSACGVTSRRMNDMTRISIKIEQREYRITQRKLKHEWKRQMRRATKRYASPKSER